MDPELAQAQVLVLDRTRDCGLRYNTDCFGVAFFAAARRWIMVSWDHRAAAGGPWINYLGGAGNREFSRQIGKRAGEQQLLRDISPDRITQTQHSISRD